MQLHPAPSGLAVGAFITSEGLDELARFKYVAGPYTIIDNVLNPWWLFSAKFVPARVSPNLVTLTGLIVTSASLCAALVVCSGDPSQYVDGNAVYVLLAFSAFAYQTLDAIDGKHARNTEQATPLGALFDHGCDCVAAIAGVMILELCSSTPATEAEEVRTPAGFVAFMVPLITFFAAQWEHLYTHAMPAGGVTEAQYCGIVTMLAAARWGPNLFQTDLSPVLPGPLAACLVALVGGPKGLLVKRVMHFLTTLFGATLTVGSIFRCIKHSGPRCLPSLLVPVGSLAALCCSLYMASTSVFAEHRQLCQIAAGLLLSDLMIRMVIAAVCRFEFPAMPATMLPFTAACVAGVALPLLGLNRDMTSQLHLGLVIIAVLWQLFSMAQLVTDSIHKVCTKLDIPFLASLPKTKKAT